MEELGWYFKGWREPASHSQNGVWWSASDSSEMYALVMSYTGNGFLSGKNQNNKPHPPDLGTHANSIIMLVGSVNSECQTLCFVDLHLPDPFLLKQIVGKCVLCVR